jgi:hypothetical protein
MFEATLRRSRLSIVAWASTQLAMKEKTRAKKMHISAQNGPQVKRR